MDKIVLSTYLTLVYFVLSLVFICIIGLRDAVVISVTDLPLRYGHRRFMASHKVARMVGITTSYRTLEGEILRDLLYKSLTFTSIFSGRRCSR